MSAVCGRQAGELRSGDVNRSELMSGNNSGLKLDEEERGRCVRKCFNPLAFRPSFRHGRKLTRRLHLEIYSGALLGKVKYVLLHKRGFCPFSAFKRP